MWLNRIKFSSLSLVKSEPSGSEPVEVRVVALDEALAELGRIDVVKIDTDGAEPLIMRVPGP